MTETETLPAIREPTRLDELGRLGTWLAMSEANDQSEKGRGATAALRLYYAIELGLTPMAAAELTVIRGRLYVGAQLLRALAVRAGYRVLRVDLSPETCTARLVSSDGRILGDSTFTIADAKQAGLIRDNSPWKTHPSRMLWARASKNVIVDFAPEVGLGMALDDEIQEVVDDPSLPFADEVAADVYVAAEEDPEIDWPDPDVEAETVGALEELAKE